jgi:cell wall-associated NlpC family hydrolase
MQDEYPVGKALGQAIADYASKYAGVAQFKWGGTNPETGVDPGGFVQHVYNRFGFTMPGMSWQQAAAGHEVPLREARPGDLIHWTDSPEYPSPSHVGVYAGNGTVVHIEGPGRTVAIEPIFDHEHAAAIRVFPNQ